MNSIEFGSQTPSYTPPEACVPSVWLRYFQQVQLPVALFTRRFQLLDILSGEADRDDFMVLWLVAREACVEAGFLPAHHLEEPDDDTLLAFFNTVAMMQVHTHHVGSFVLHVIGMPVPRQVGEAAAVAILIPDEHDLTIPEAVRPMRYFLFERADGVAGTLLCERCPDGSHRVFGERAATDEVAYAREVLQVLRDALSAL